LMIGDSLVSDFVGSTSAGLNGMLLRRKEGNTLLDT
jgi:FMN phosphatase YigB (HAD superfamily)